MYKNLSRFFQIMIVVGVVSVAAAMAQTTSGTVTINGTVSKYVEIASGGGATVAGNSGGGVTTDGTLNNPLAVVVNMGELGPSNANSFVTATVPIKLRSNAAYNLSLSATVTSTGSTSEKIGASDIGFGIGAFTRPAAIGVYAAGVDTNGTSGSPTLAAGSTNGTTGRYEFTATKSNLAAFSTPQLALSGDRIMNAVPSSNPNGLIVPAIFAVKPAFFEAGTTNAVATFTITAP